MKLLTTICIAALAIAFCVPAFAGVQNVKVSGDINVWSLARRGINANSLDKTANVANTWNTTTIFIEQVGVNVAADLTDNVSTYVRVINERDWDVVGNASMDIDLDEAYVTLKEMLYAPLTVKLGRQNIWFGKGFIVGANTGSWDANGSLTVNEISDSTAFDAIRGTLDYDPWTIDLVAAKIDENTAASTDDVDLYGINVGYKFDKYNAEAEAYLWAKFDRSDRDTIGGVGEDSILCPGLRGSLKPYDPLYVYGEIAFQDGSYRRVNTATNSETAKDRKAWALDIGADYTLADIKWTPVIGAEYIYYSGAEAENSSSDWTGWDMMYRGKFDSQIREYLDVLYATQFSTGLTSATARRIAGNTNQQQLVLKGAIDPMQDVKVSTNVNLFWLNEKLDFTANNQLVSDANAGEAYVGTEWDATVAYDYTEDVRFEVLGGIFWPGEVYASGKDDTVAQVAGRCTVEF